MFLVFQTIDANDDTVDFKIQFGNVRFHFGEVFEIKQLRFSVRNAQFLSTPIRPFDLGLVRRIRQPFDRISDKTKSHLFGFFGDLKLADPAGSVVSRVRS